MIYALKTFYRNRVANLTIRSIRHFRPDAEIHVLCLQAPGRSYSDQEPLLVGDEYIHYAATKYYDLGPSVANQLNNLFFSEGFNLLYDILRDRDDKVLLLAEDHFFTTGATIAELEGTDFDVAYASWNTGANGSILGIRPTKLAAHFPIPEHRTTVEGVFGDWAHAVPHRHRISTRVELDYKGDGYYANTYEEIEPAVRALETTK